MRLFSISSPLIFYFSQNIAFQLKDNKNLQFLWYVEGAEKHLQSYDILSEHGIWTEKIVFHKGKNYNDFNFMNFIKFKRRINELIEIEENILKLLTEKKIKQVFIGNRNAPIDRLLYYCSKQLGIEVNLIEDGLTNYLNFRYHEKPVHGIFSYEYIKRNVKGLFYKALRRDKVFWEDDPLIFDNIYAIFPDRYFLKNYKKEIKKLRLNDKIPKYKECINNLMSSKEYEMLWNNSKKNILFLSQSLSEDRLTSLDTEIMVLADYFKTVLNNTDYRLIIKPHPRDKKDKIDRLVKELGNNNVCVLNNDTPIPIELLLDNIEVNEIVGIWSAPLFYTSLVREDISCVSLLFRLIEISNDDNSKLIRLYNHLKTVFPTEVIWFNPKKKGEII
ncbi:polysialyltransferase family glycosyltransferase [Metabacillus halosaccharovorans]|uniref:polysialyltransferase family glycosyltransferase n=1 Tax=Metabacillus halosaccharovorans TaxID=930124 RepID=UPI003735AD1B